jgi:hypothetical protein
MSKLHPIHEAIKTKQPLKCEIILSPGVLVAGLTSKLILGDILESEFNGLKAKLLSVFDEGEDNG